MASLQKSLDLKLARITANPACGDFILADAKDADMAFGLAATGLLPGGTPGRGPYRSIEEYRDAIRELVAEGLVDIMLMSASTSEVLTVGEGLFADSPVTPAVRMNDTTDIWNPGGSSRCHREPAQPFATTTVAQARCGRIDCAPDDGGRTANLGLFSVTFNDDATRDRAMLEAYKAFRAEAERAGFRHFLEVFAPNAAAPRSDGHALDVPRFLADAVVRALAGVPRPGRPLFLKMPYLGPQVTEQLAAYDRSLVVGVLGGAAGTTHDAFTLLANARKHGARVALFGRKINAAEHQPSFVRFLRFVADGVSSPAEAVRGYHAELDRRSIRPQRSLEADLELTPGG